MLRSFRFMMSLAVLLVLAAGSVTAAGKPKGASGTDPQVIYKLYAGKTSHWNRGGTAYWAPDGSFRGINKNRDWIGEGKWYVTTSSKLCYEALWREADAASTESDSGKWCWEFVTAPDGQIWERFLPERTDWYLHKTEKQHNGETQKAVFRSLKAKAGS